MDFSNNHASASPRSGSVKATEDRPPETGSSSFDPASYIQAAARNIMDEHCTDGEDYESSTIPRDQTHQSAPRSPGLQSLQTQRPSPMPDEQDRKRFVGCLAAVLASSYDYEELDLVAEDDMSKAEISAYLAVSTDEDDEDSIGGNNTFSDDQSEPSLYSSNADGFKSLGRDRKSRPRPKAVHRTNPDSSSTGSQRNKGQEARIRHRKRRYDVLSKLLLSSAELLQLEKGQVKAFLPILSKLLLPNSHHRPYMHSQSSGCINDRFSPANRKRANLPDPKLLYSAAVHSFSSVGSSDFYSHQLDRIEHLRPFLESLTPGAGFRCLAMFLLQHLLSSQDGYDARVRHAIKTLGVLVLVRDMENDPVDVLLESDHAVGLWSLPGHGGVGHKRKSRMDLVELATRKFEALEVAIAGRLIILSRIQEPASRSRRQRQRHRPNEKSVTSQRSDGFTREEMVRGLKVGGTALIAGTLFAVTGGLAAPGIAAGVGMLMGGTAVTAAATAVLTSTAAVTAIFGVGGGGLAAYKMHRRTEGLKEFEFQKESHRRERALKASHTVEGDLFSTIAVSGWLCDELDFQRPWGVTPTRPRIKDRCELLERFYTVYRPDHVPKSRQILQSWEGEEKELWMLLREKYGTDPDSLFPLNRGPRIDAQLTLEQEELLTELLVELGLVDAHSTSIFNHFSPMNGMMKERDNWNNCPSIHVDGKRLPRGSGTPARPQARSRDAPTVMSAILENVSINGSKEERAESKERPNRLATVWSYLDDYGGELYTIRWESELLTELCDSVSDLALELVTGSTAQVLKHTALATLMSAIAWPYALVSAANMIDGTWTLAVERADLAGKELARSLLFSKAGRRPVTLVGFSFGARVVYACLKQLAVYQVIWEEYQESGRMSCDLETDSTGGTFENMREPASIVEDAILMGLPNHLSLSSWKACRQVVAGRLVNCFSNKDLILSLMFQFKRLGLKPVCGTCPVNVDGVENIDVTDLVQGHQDYCYVTGSILKRVRLSQPFASRPTRLFVPDFNNGRALET